MSGGASSASRPSLADDLRAELLAFYERRDETFTENTLLTNSRFAQRRADTLLEVLFKHSGLRGLDGLRVLDIGCGFGALAVTFADMGAEVVAIDPNAERMRVGEAVAHRRGLPVAFRRASMQHMDVAQQAFDLAVMNNSLCYLVDDADRRRALVAAHRSLRAGGWIAIRNPNRLFPIDQFTGLPLVGLFGSDVAGAVARRMGRPRSRVRLRSTPAAVREVRRAGYVDVASDARMRGGGRRRRPAIFARYQHVVGRRPHVPSSAAS